MKFRDWFFQNDKFLEAYNPFSESLRTRIIKKLVAAGANEAEATKYVKDFERIRGMPQTLWLKKDAGIANPGMDDPTLNINIPVKSRNNIDLYTNIEDLKKVVEKANDVLSVKPPVTLVRERMIKSKGLPLPKQGEPANDIITEIDGYISSFKEIKSRFNLNTWKEFMLKPSTKELTGMGDKDFDIGDKEKGIPNISIDRRYNLSNYDYLEQLQAVVYRIQKIFKEIADEQQSGDENKEISSAQLGEVKMLLSGIEVVINDENCIVWNPKTAEECIKIKDAEMILNPKCNPGWCICWKDQRNQFNNYRYNHLRTFYIVKSKKNPTHKDLWNFFVIGAEPNQYVITPLPNQDQVRDWSYIVGIAPYLEPYKSVLKNEELSEKELEIKNKFSSYITPENFANLSVEDKELIYDIYGQTKDFDIPVLEITPKPILNKYFGFQKIHPTNILGWLEKPENEALSNRYFNSISRMIENNTERNLFSYTDSTSSYAAFIFSKWDKFKENSLKNISQPLFSHIFSLLEKKYGDNAYEEIVKKFTVDKKGSVKTMSNLDSSKRLIIFKSKIESIGIDAVLENENLKFFLAALDNKDLADVFKTYGLDKIFNHFKADEIRQNGKEWEEILVGQNFNEIIKYLPVEIVRQFNKDTILSTFMGSDEESLGKIKSFFSLGNSPIIDTMIENPNRDSASIVKYFQINPERFISNTSNEYYNKINKDSYIFILNNLQKHVDIFINNYFEKSTHFADGISLALVNNSTNPLGTANKIFDKFGNNIEPKIIMEVLFGVKNLKYNIEFVNQDGHKELIVSKLSPHDYADLVTRFGSKYVVEAFGKQILQKIGTDLDRGENTPYEKMFNRMKDGEYGMPGSGDDRIENIIQFLKHHNDPFKIAPINHWIETLDSAYKNHVIDTIVQNDEINLNGREVAWLLHLSPDPYRTSMHMGPEELRKISNDASVMKENPFMILALNTIMKLSDPKSDPNSEKPIQFFKALGEFGKKYMQHVVDAMTGKKSTLTFKMQANKMGDQFKPRIEQIAKNLNIPIN